MRNVLALWMIGLSTLVSGCQLAENAMHNLTYETKLKTEEIAENCRYKKLAQEHWQRIQQSHSEKTGSKDYADGFMDGFIDFIVYGGNGQPPFVPPQQYWGAHYRTPEGYQAVQDWYAGFRHGAAVAQESGHRQYAIVPSSQNVLTPGDATSTELARHGKKTSNPELSQSSQSGKSVPKKMLPGKSGASASSGDTPKPVSNSMTQSGITWGKVNVKQINHEITEVQTPLKETEKSSNLSISVLLEPVSHVEQNSISTPSSAITDENSPPQIIHVPRHPNTEKKLPNIENHSNAIKLIDPSNSDSFPVDEPRAKLQLAFLSSHPNWHLGNPVSIASDQFLTYPREIAASKQGIQGSVVIMD